LGGACRSGAKLAGGPKAAAQGAGIAAMTSLWQENVQLRARVAGLQSSLHRAQEQLQAHCQQWQLPEKEEGKEDEEEEVAVLPVEKLCVGNAVLAPGKADIGPPSALPTPELAYLLDPPPGLPLPMTSLPRATLPRAAPPCLSPEDSAPLPRPSRSSQPPAPASCAADEGAREAPLRVLPALGSAGAAGACVEWRVDCPHVRLRANRGCPLLSPSFSLGALAGLRLMFTPGATWAAQQVKTKCKHQRLEAPCNGALQLKATSTGDGALLHFYLIVGGQRQGPCHCDFAEHAVQGCDIECDWLRQIDREAGCLRFRLEFV